MYSARAKMLHPLLACPCCHTQSSGGWNCAPRPSWPVLGHQRAEVEKALVARHGQGTVTVVEQTEQMGTGHAVRLGLTALRGWEGTVLILYATCHC